MTWNEASELIAEKITQGKHIDSNSTYRYVVNVNYPCSRYDYNGNHGYRITIGKRSNLIEAPLSMLKALFEAALGNSGVYNISVIKELFPQQVKDHSCHVHVIGKLFSSAGVMKAVNKHDYKIVD